MTRRTWAWASSGSWWWTGRPGVLQSTGWQRVRRAWAAEQKQYSALRDDEPWLSSPLGVTGDSSSGPHSLPAACSLATFLSRWHVDKPKTTEHEGVKRTLLHWLFLRNVSGSMPESSLHGSSPWLGVWTLVQLSLPCVLDFGCEWLCNLVVRGRLGTTDEEASLRGISTHKKVTTLNWSSENSAMGY